MSFNISPNVIFKVNDLYFVIYNKNVDFEQIFFDVKWRKTGKIYRKNIDVFRSQITFGTIQYVGVYDNDPDIFNLARGIVFYHDENKKYYLIIGGSIKNGEYYSRFVEVEKQLYRWLKKDVVFTVNDNILISKQIDGVIWSVGIDNETTDILTFSPTPYVAPTTPAPALSLNDAATKRTKRK